MPIFCLLSLLLSKQPSSCGQTLPGPNSPVAPPTHHVARHFLLQGSLQWVNNGALGGGGELRITAKATMDKDGMKQVGLVCNKQFDNFDIFPFRAALITVIMSHAARAFASAHEPAQAPLQPSF